MVYKNILKTLENKPSDLWFEIFITYFTKKNDFKSIVFLLEKTTWKKSKNNEGAINMALLASIEYKKPGFNLFYKLFENIDFKIYESQFSNLKYTPEDIKNFKIQEIIKLLIDYDKFNFLEPFSKKEGLHIYEKATKYLVEKKLINKLKNLYDSRPEIINEYIEIKKDSGLKQMLFYYSMSLQFKNLLLLNQPYVDKIVLSHSNFKINSQAFSISNFLTNNKLSMAKKWLDISFSEKTQSEKTEIMECIIKKVNFSEKYNLKNISFLNKYCLENSLYQNDDVLDKYNMLVKKTIFKIIKHNKCGYLEKLKKELELKQIFFDTSILSLYVNSVTSEKMDDFLFQEIDNKKFNLRDKINHYMLNRKMVIFLKDYSWDEIEKEQSKFLSKDNGKELFFDYLILKNKENKNIKKIKI